MPRRMIILIAVLIAASLMMYLLSATGGPSEKNRVAHPAGYSIICPRRWHPEIIQRPEGAARDAINLKPDQWMGLAPQIWVRRLDQPPNLDDLKKRGFVEGSLNFSPNAVPAWLHMEQRKQYINREAVFEENGWWYDLGVSLPGVESLKVEDWWKYVETFRPTPPTAPPSTAPTPAANR